MNNRRPYINTSSVKEALAIIQGDDSEFEGCEDNSDEDPEAPDYTLIRQSICGSQQDQTHV